MNKNQIVFLFVFVMLIAIFGINVKEMTSEIASSMFMLWFASLHNNNIN